MMIETRGTPRTWAKVLAVAAFVAAIVSANWLTDQYGLVTVGPGMVATAGTWLAGLVLLLRDGVHETVGPRGAFVAIGAAGIIVAAVASPALAMASWTAFVVSELADMGVYTPLRDRHWGWAAFASGVVGAIVDTVLFLAIAGFPVWEGLPGQVFAKVTVTAVAVAAVGVVRALLRHRVGARRP